MLGILWKYAHREKVSAEGKKLAKAQLIRIARMIPALAIFLLPGGILLLPLLAKALPWELLPRPFKEPQTSAEVKAILPTDVGTLSPPLGPHSHE